MNKKRISVEVFETKPHNFQPHVEVAACYIEINGALLLLQCGHRKPEVGFWGIPAGKIEHGETPEQAARRELFEETGIQTTNPFHPFGVLYIRKPEMDYAFHLFQLHLDRKPSIRLSDEHLDYKWACHHELEQLDLMIAAKELLQKCHEWKAR